MSSSSHPNGFNKILFMESFLDQLAEFSKTKKTAIKSSLFGRASSSILAFSIACRDHGAGQFYSGKKNTVADTKHGGSYEAKYGFCSPADCARGRSLRLSGHHFKNPGKGSGYGPSAGDH